MRQLNYKTLKYNFMKALNKILWFIFISSLLISCGDEGEKYVATPHQVTETYVFRAPIRGFQGRLGIENELEPIRLADIIGEQASQNLVNAEMQIADCYLEVRGLKSMENTPVLKDFTIQVEGRAGVNFGNCTAKPSLATDFESDRRQSIPKVSNFIKLIFDTYTGTTAKRANIVMSFTPTQDIFVEDNVELIITITGTYTYNTYSR